MRNALPRIAAATTSGLLWALAFSSYAPHPIGPWLSWLALVPLLLALLRGSFGTGWWFGVVFWTTSIHWIAPTLVTFGGLPRLGGWLSLLLLASYLALFQGAFAWMAHRLLPGSSRLPETLALLTVPSAWVLQEMLYGWLFTGFPWNPAAQAWTDLPGALSLAAWIGAPGVSWLVILVPTALVCALRSLEMRPLLVTSLVVALLLAMADRWAVPVDAAPGEAASIEAALVQPNADLFTDWHADEVERQYAATLDLLTHACAEGNLVIVPESAAFPYSYSIHERLAADIDGLADRGCALVLNSSRPADGGTFNTAMLITDAGVEGSYDKVHLVPWGEYVPLKTVLPFMQQIARGASEFAAGREVDGLDWAGNEIGVSICYDAIYADQTRKLVDAGAGVLVHITNDAWYGDTSAPRQLLRASRFRAAESGRYVLRAALTGVSAVIAADGSVEQDILLGQSGIVRTRVPLRTNTTLYQRVPWLVPTLSGLLLAFAIVAHRRSHRLARAAGD